jgi:hypothetical protein
LTTDGFPEDEMKATLLVGDHNNIIKVKGIDIIIILLKLKVLISYS